MEGDRERRRERGLAMQVLALDAAVAEIFALMHKRSLHPLLIKGPGTAHWLYDNLSERHYGDIDLLVAPDEFKRAKAALVEIGFAQAELGSRQTEHWLVYHENLVRGRVSLELHRTLSMLSASHELVWKLFSADAQTIEVATASVTVPSTAAATLIVVLHAIQHGRRRPTSMRDLERALERVDFATWEAAAELARRLEAVPAFAAGLRLAPQGAELAMRLRLAPDPISRVVHLRAMTPPPVALGIERVVAAAGATARLTLLVHKLVPSPAFMRVWKPIARRGRWGLACAYAWRPLWLVAKLPEAIRAWRAADRDTQRVD